MAAISALDAGGENIILFLDLTAHSEGASNSPITVANGYDVIVTGVDGPEVFTNYGDHPFAPSSTYPGGRPPRIIRRVPLLESTASGRYQILLRYFMVYKRQLHLPDFSPVSQDKVAIEMIKERRAIPHIISGDIEAAITLCATTWASMPGNNYGQGSHSMASLLGYWATISASEGASV